MSIEVAEPRINTVDDVIAFAKPLGCDVSKDRLVPPLSLVAHEGGQMVGAALCHHDGYGLPTLDIVLSDTADPQALVRLLIDKVLLKLQAKGIAKCKINTYGQTDDSGFWSAAQWTGSCEPDAA